MGYSFTHGGVDLGGTDYGLIVRRGPRPVMGPRALAVFDYAGRPGGHVFGGQPGVLRFEYAGLVRGSSRSDLFRRLDRIAAVLDPGDGDKWHVPDEYTSLDAALRRGCWARLDGSPVYREHLGALAASVELGFVCSAGVWLAASTTTQTVTLTTSPQTITIPATGAVAGTAPARPVWTFDSDSDLVQDVTLTNTTTGEGLRWSGILRDAWMRVDSERQHMEYSEDAGATWRNGMRYKVGGGAFPRLRPAVANTIIVTGMLAGALTITYRGAWL